MAPRKGVKKTRADNTMTEAQYHSTVKGALRQGTRFWKPKLLCLERAYVGRKTNKATGRLAKHYKCAACKQDFPSSLVQVDHIEPVIDPIKGFKSWDEVVDRMYCNSDKLQVLCKPCHKLKTASERKQRGSK